jgi:glycosyltransferase involved in cell wall biosynthesis
MSTPRVSVVFATHNRAARLDALLHALRAQTLPADQFEVIAVDDGSHDGTQDVLTAHGRAGALQLRTVRRDTPGGPGVARNEGWPLARSQLVAFTDDDCVPTPRWLEAGLAAHAANPGAVIQGRVDINPDELDQMTLFSHFFVQHNLDAAFPTCNIFYPRELLERLRGFDTDAFPTVAAEDTDMAWRAFKLGASAVWAPEAHVLHGVLNEGPLKKLRVAARNTPAVQLYRRHPEMRKELVHGLFWRENHYLFTRFVIGLLLPRRIGRVRLGALRLALAAPYLARVTERRAGLVAPYMIAVDAIEVAAIAHGAIRYRVPVI